MKSALILEDTPDGLKTKLVWQPSGHQDHLPDSISMHLMAFLVRHIEDLEKSKALRVVRSGDDPSATRQPVA
jgi:hypothetical protein